MIKRFIPSRIKRFLWFLLKAPQRTIVGKYTLFLDLKAWLHVLFASVSYRRVTVCVGVKNRSANLLRLIDSLNRCAYLPLIDLSIYNCGSDDVQDLHSEIQNRWKGNLLYAEGNHAFARSQAFNKAVDLAQSDCILLCDADMTAPRELVKKVSKYTGEGFAWFPEVWYTNQDGSGRFYTESTGMMACMKSDFVKAGKLDETITEWGKEDWLLFLAMYRHHIACLRTRERDFVHHWHPSLKPDGFIPLF